MSWRMIVWGQNRGGTGCIPRLVGFLPHTRAILSYEQCRVDLEMFSEYAYHFRIPGFHKV